MYVCMYNIYICMCDWHSLDDAVISYNNNNNNIFYKIFCYQIVVLVSFS